MIVQAAQWSRLAVQVRSGDDPAIHSTQELLDSAHRCELKAEAAQQNMKLGLHGFKPVEPATFVWFDVSDEGALEVPGVLYIDE